MPGPKKPAKPKLPEDDLIPLKETLFGGVNGSALDNYLNTSDDIGMSRLGRVGRPKGSSTSVVDYTHHTRNLKDPGGVSTVKRMGKLVPTLASEVKRRKRKRKTEHVCVCSKCGMRLDVATYSEIKEPLCPTCQYAIDRVKNCYKGHVGLPNMTLEQIARLPTYCREAYTKHMDAFEKDELKKLVSKLEHERVHSSGFMLGYGDL